MGNPIELLLLLLLLLLWQGPAALLHPQKERLPHPVMPALGTRLWDRALQHEQHRTCDVPLQVPNLQS